MIRKGMFIVIVEKNITEKLPAPALLIYDQIMNHAFLLLGISETLK